MKKIILSYLLFLLVFTRGNAQVMDWVLQLSQYHQSMRVEFDDASIDTSLNSYVICKAYCGMHPVSEILNVNPKGTTYNVTYNTYVNMMAEFILKYDSAQKIVGVIQIAVGSGQIRPSQIYIDAYQNIYVAGKVVAGYNYSSNFGIPGIVNGDVSQKMFIAKYGPGRDLKAFNTFYKIQNSSFYKLGGYNSDGVYIYSEDTMRVYDNDLNLIFSKPIASMPVLISESGYYSLNGFNNEHGYAVTTEPAQLKYDTLSLYHYSSNGDLISSKNISQPLAGSSAGFSGNFLNESKSSKIILSGDFWGDTHFGLGANSTLISNHDSISNVTPNGVTYSHHYREYHAEIDTNGNLIWMRVFPESGPLPTDIAIDDANNIYLFGLNKQNMLLDPVDSIHNTVTQLGFYVIKYDSSFNFKEVYNFNNGFYSSGHLKMLHNKAVVFGGSVADLDFTSGVHMSTSLGSFISQYSGFPVYVPPVPSGPQSDSLVVWPNPSDGLYNLTLGNNFTSGTLSIFNAVGQLIFSSQLNGVSHLIDLSAFEAGLYIVTVNDGEKISSARLVKSTE